MKKFTFITILTLCFLQSSIAQTDSITLGLKGHIVRALEQSPNDQTIIYAGLKGSNLGTGTVYKSTDSGATWHALNDGQPIDPYVSDIQAIAELNTDKKTLFAGTWKNGLFKSIDGGQTWVKDILFPTSDIRSIRVGKQQPNLVYASTSNFGVVKSTDGGNNWQRVSPEVLEPSFQFAWSIELDPNDDNIIYAQTFSNGVWKSTDQGENWSQILTTQGLVCWDLKVSESSNELWVAASKRGDNMSAIFHSADQGQTWNELNQVPQIGINQIQVINHNTEKIVVVGSWQDGVYQLKSEEWSKVDAVDFGSIAHVLDDGDNIIVGSWGNGIYRFEPE